MATPVPTNIKVQEALNFVILQFTVTFLFPPVDPMTTPQDAVFIAALAASSGFPALYFADGSVQTSVSGGGRYTYTYQCRYATAPFVNIGLPGPRGLQGSPGPAGPTLDHPAAWDQQTWHIDPIAGLDTNDGLTAGTALQHAAEYRRRVGPVHEFDRQITMTIHSSLPVTDTLDLSGLRTVGWDGFSASAWYFDVVGIPTVVASGVAVSRTFDQVNNIPHGLSCAALGNLSTHVRMGRMIRKTSGVNSTDDATHLATAAWLAKNEDGTIARMSYPATLDDALAKVQCNQGVINTGDTFDIVDLCRVPVVEHPSSEVVRFKRLYFSSEAQTAHEVKGSTYIHCAFDIPIVTPLGYNKFANCQHGWAIMVVSGAIVYVTQGLFLGTTFVLNGRLAIQNYTLLQGVKTWEVGSDEGESAGVSCHTRGFGVFDSPVSGLLVPMGQVWQIAGTIYGTGNAGYAIEVKQGGKLNVYGPSVGDVFYLTGALGDIKVGGRTFGPAVSTQSPYAYTADRSYTLANLRATVVAGGFDYNIFDPLNPSTCIVKGF